MSVSAPLADQIDDDEQELRRLGVVPALDRSLDVFANFGLSYSIICVVAGGITSFASGFATLGGAAIGLGWPAGVAISLLVALSMSHIASAYPTAGSLYSWTTLLAGKRWGRIAGWSNILGLIFVTASINVGLAQLCLGFAEPFFAIPRSESPWPQLVIVTVTSLTQALINTAGIRLVGRLMVVNIYLISLTAVALGMALIFVAPALDFTRLWTFSNFSGMAGADVWPHRDSLFGLFVLSLLMPCYTITGFDVSAHAAEETFRPANEVPRAILVSVITSGVLGFYLVVSIVLAIPNIAEAASHGTDLFYWLIGRLLPRPVAMPLIAAMLVANYLCGLAAVTSASRMVYAAARCGEMPLSAGLRCVSTAHRVPRAAIWTVGFAVILVTLSADLYSLLSSSAVILLYGSYGVPILAALLARQRGWTTHGPFDLGRWFSACAVAALAGIGLLFFAGVQPPNDFALYVVLAVTVLLVVTGRYQRTRDGEGGRS